MLVGFGAKHEKSLFIFKVYGGGVILRIPKVKDIFMYIALIELQGCVFDLEFELPFATARDW